MRKRIRISNRILETMEKFCTYLDETCGGTRAYLESIGVTSEEIDAIIRKLTD